MRRKLYKLIILILTAALCLTVMVEPIYALKYGEREIEIGREAAKDLEKELKIVKDPAINERVNRIGQAIAAVANSIKAPAGYGGDEVTKFDYTFKIVEDKDINAFSLPGGFIYINTGLLDFVQSDDELAGVIAHEIAHAAHHHMVHLLKEQAKLNNQIAAGLLVMILSKTAQRDVSNAMLGLQLYKTAVTSGYGQKAEADADQTAVFYMAHASYNPVGLLTFIERLAKKPEVVNMGIFQTHPPSRERAKAIISQLQRMNIPINRRLVTKAIQAEYIENDNENEKYATIVLDGQPVMKVTECGGQSASIRAATIAARINQALDEGLELRQVRIGNGSTVLAKNLPIVTLTDNDAIANGKDATDIAKDLVKALKRVITKQEIDQLY